ncbi:MAG: DUF2249 domain-containing protein [Proteobacteria bacterium]|nr:DUF2249 domain-containing protein [Pseudomonadota bacterium]
MTVQPSAPRWQADDGYHIDVRGLPAPQPMLQILALLETIPAGAVIVHHDREPIYLYPELTERGWNHELLPGAGDEVRLRLWRNDV